MHATTRSIKARENISKVLTERERDIHETVYNSFLNIFKQQVNPSFIEVSLSKKNKRANERISRRFSLSVLPENSVLTPLVRLLRQIAGDPSGLIYQITKLILETKPALWTHWTVLASLDWS